MKKILFYFDHTVTKIFVEKVNEEGEKKVVLSSPNNFVYTGEIVARIIDLVEGEDPASKADPGYGYYNIVDFRSLRADTGIFFDEASNAYKASEYGFVVLDGNTIKWLSPITVTKDKLKAYYTVYPTKLKRIPSVKDIEETLHSYRIITGVGEKRILEQLGGININTPKVTRLLVAEGREPVSGHEEYYLPLVSVEKKAGEILSDGRINFKETGSIIQVYKDQEILKKIPAVKPSDGFNVYGDKAPAEIVEHNGFKKGPNIVQSGKDELIYCSAIDGCMEIVKKVVSVLEIVVINGDVNYDTGNIKFNGSVRINGSVLPGFSVVASGDVIIEKNVDDAYIEADGDIIVKMGAVGKESVKLVSNGKVTAKYLLNARVEAADEIIVEDSIINCNVFSNNKISVVAKHGKIIGGVTTALYDIIVNVTGAINETETVLNVGRNLYIEKELDEVRLEINKWREAVTEVMRKMKVSFGEAVFENPKDFISRLPSVKKRNCLLLLKELSDSNRELKRLTENAKEIQGKLKLEREPGITIKNKAYPGTVINVKKSIKKIDKVFENVKFYEDPEEKIIRFTPAS